MTIAEADRNHLIERIKTNLQEAERRYLQYMEDAQQEANAHKGAMESRYDTFKEEAQALRDGYARQLETIQELREQIRVFERERDRTPTEEGVITIGSLVRTVMDGNIRQDYLIFFNMGSEVFEVNGRKVRVITPHTPLAQALLGSDEGECIDFQGKQVEIETVIV